VRIAIVCPYDLGRHGGVQDQTIRLTGWLRDAGHQAVLIGPGTEGPAGAVLVGGTTVVPANRASTPISVDPLVGARIADAVRDFDVVHIHEPLMPTISTTAMRLRGVAIVATFHADPPGWVRMLYRYGKRGVRRLLRRADVVTSVSRVAAGAIDGVVPYRIISNGIDVDDYVTGPKDPRRVVFLGRDDERKGLSVLLDAWPSIIAAVPGADLVVVGAERNEGPEGVEFLGSVSEATKRTELGAAAICVAPNLGGESFGIVVLEEMASAAAVVASAIPAFVHVLEDAGVLVAAGDTAGLARAVVALLGDAEERERLGRAARTRSMTFDGSVVAAAYMEAYEDALESRASRT
jgi:phosphatidylinositol alpha-mannosyltransferase